MYRTILAAALAVGGLVVAPTTASACNPKTHPGCDRQAELTGPVACDPKTDPGCDIRQAELTGLVACDPKVDPSCD